MIIFNDMADPSKFWMWLLSELHKDQKRQTQGKLFDVSLRWEIRVYNSLYNDDHQKCFKTILAQTLIR